MLTFALFWQAYLSKAAPQILAANQLPGLLGVFQKLIASKALDHEGYKLLESMLMDVKLAGLQQYLPTVRVSVLAQTFPGLTCLSLCLLYCLSDLCLKVPLMQLYAAMRFTMYPLPHLAAFAIAGLAANADTPADCQNFKSNQRLHSLHSIVHRQGGSNYGTAKPGRRAAKPFYDSSGADMAAELTVHALSAYRPEDCSCGDD